MKKTILFIALSVMGVLSSFAQKTTVTFEDTQARLLDVNSNSYVKPLTCELNIKGEKISHKVHISDLRVKAMGGDPVNMRSYAVFDATKKYDCDIIVGGTFNIVNSENGDGYDVELIGYPADFINWKTATESDYKWIVLDREGKSNAEEKKEKTDAVRKGIFDTKVGK